MPEKQALLVGIDRYPHSSLQFCEEDTHALCSSLGSFGFVSPEVLVNAPSELVRARLKDYVDRVQLGDTFLFYFAGHGVHQGGNSYLLCADGTLEEPRGLTLAEISELMDRMPAAQKILICDACRNQTDSARGGEQPGMAAQMFGEFERIGTRHLAFGDTPSCSRLEADWHVLLSCSQGERSWEDAILHHGVFTYHLFKSLDLLARTAQPGDISMAHVASHVGAGVHEWSSGHPERKMRPHSIGLGTVKLKLQGIDPYQQSGASPNWIEVPAGEIVWGERRQRIEKFLVSSHPITVGSYAAGAQLPRNPPDTNRNWAWRDRPITCVSWTDAMDWCAKLNATLPTEAQWEYLRTHNFEAVVFPPILEWCFDAAGSLDLNRKIVRGFNGRRTRGAADTDESLGFRCVRKTVY